jgi:hypothetical protein
MYIGENQNPQYSQHPIHGTGGSENIRANSRNKTKQIEVFKNLADSKKKSVPHDSQSSGCLKNQVLFIMICTGLSCQSINFQNRYQSSTLKGVRSQSMSQ